MSFQEEFAIQGLLCELETADLDAALSAKWKKKQGLNLIWKITRAEFAVI